MMKLLPKDYDLILRQQYGDYMTPRQAPSYHGGFLFLDANVPYEVYLAGHNGEIRKVKWERIVCQVRKILKNELSESREAITSL